MAKGWFSRMQVLAVLAAALPLFGFALLALRYVTLLEDRLRGTHNILFAMIETDGEIALAEIAATPACGPLPATRGFILTWQKALAGIDKPLVEQ